MLNRMLSWLRSYALPLLTCALLMGAGQQTFGAARNLTVVQSANGTVITVVGQEDGYVTTCSYSLQVSPMAAKCASIGRVATAANPPAASGGLTVLPSPSDPVVWIINNATGEISICETLQSAPGDVSGSCKSLGVAKD